MSVAIGRSTWSGATSCSSSYSPTSNAVAGPAAFIHTTPSVVVVRIAVAHGRTCRYSTSAVRRMPASARRSSSHARACARHASDDHTALP